MTKNWSRANIEKKIIFGKCIFMAEYISKIGFFKLILNSVSSKYTSICNIFDFLYRNIHINRCYTSDFVTFMSNEYDH